MRGEVSDEKRKRVLIISALCGIFLVICVAVLMHFLTRSVLNNDAIYANAECVKIEKISNDTVQSLKVGDDLYGIDVTDEMIDGMKLSKKGVCFIGLKFNVGNFTGKNISNFSFSPIASEYAKGEIYAYSKISDLKKEGSEYSFSINVIADIADIDNSYFESELPLSFSAPYRYDFSYYMEGQIGKKTLGFSTENIKTDENDKNKETSSDAQN